MLEGLARDGATQVEPGHGLTGTTPLHAVADLAEEPAIAYVSEVSHLWNGKAYVFGGGSTSTPSLERVPPGLWWLLRGRRRRSTCVVG